MKLFLLKTLLQRRLRDEGFTLPMVIALGLVMLLLAAINITVANEENLTAITQNSRSDSLAIAEVGIARYRELLDRNRVLAINDHSQWGTLDQVCDDNIASLLPTPPPSSAPPGTLPTLSWQKITETDTLNLDNDSNTTEDLGSYALVSYDYNLTNGSNNFNQTDDTQNVVTVGGNTISATGTLTVRGRAADNSGESQIEVDIPIRINLDDMINLAPALWIGDNQITAAELGNLTIGNGNVVIKDPAVTTGTTRDGCRNFAEDPDPDPTKDNSPNLASGITTTTGTVVSDPRDLPPIQEVVANVAAAKTAYSVAASDPLNIPLENVPNTGQWLFGATRQDDGTGTSTFISTRPYNPETNSTNCLNIKLCRYYYDFPGSTELTYTNTDLLTDGVARTTLLLNRDLKISATSGNVKVGSTSNLVNDSNAFEIYVRDDDTDPTNGSANNITINADNNRTVTIHGFIHAPQSTLTITGDGTGTVNILGSVWVNDFDNSAGTTVNISPDLVSREPTLSNPATSGRAYRFYSTTPNRTARPLTGSPTNWKTEQISP